MPFSVEEIPNEDHIYYRIHRNLIKDQEVIPYAFRNVVSGMSTDWSKYSTPEESRNRARIPSENGIIVLNVGEVRAIPSQTVIHTPSDNRAHSEVFGNKTQKVRIKFMEVYDWIIRPD